MRRTRTLLVLIGAAVALPACGGDAPIEIDGAWARTSPEGTDRGAVYFEITAADGDTLLGADVDPAVAADAQIHEMVAMMSDGPGGEMSDDMDEMAGGAGSDDDMAHGDGETAMTMQEMRDGLVLPAGETVVLEPGGVHVMLLDLVDPLETGETFDVTLRLADGDDVTVEVAVRESAP